MRISLSVGAALFVAALLSGCEIDVPVFASGEVSVFDAKISRSSKWQLNSKQLVDLRVWLTDRKAGWSAAGKIPPESVVVLTDTRGGQFHIRITRSSVMANGNVKEFPVKEVSALKIILGIKVDG